MPHSARRGVRSGNAYMALVRVTGFPALDTALIVVPREGPDESGIQRG